MYYLNASDMSELNNDLNDECLNVCIYVCMYVCVYTYINKKKLFMSEDYSCSLFNNNVQSDKTTNKLSISQTSSQQL